MHAMSKTFRPLRHAFVISLLGAVVLGTGLIAAGPAAAKGHPARAQKHLRLRRTHIGGRGGCRPVRDQRPGQLGDRAQDRRRVLRGQDP